MMAGCSKAFSKSKREIKRIGEKTEREKEEVIFETFLLFSVLTCGHNKTFFEPVYGGRR